MKEIRLPYEEYKAMEELLHKQDEAIKKLQDSSHVIVVDKRFSENQLIFDRYFSHYDIPKIITDSEAAKSMFKEELDHASEKIKSLKIELLKYRFEKSPEIEVKKWYQLWKR
jgi:hypothetical protein